MHLKTKSVIILLLTVILLSSCSSFFTAGVSGTVTDVDDKTAISGVSIFVYTSESARDTAYASYTYDYDKPFVDSSALYRTTSANDGSFTIQSVKWNTNRPTYGKDGDNITVYPLFFERNYGLVKGSSISITSNSNNNSAIKQELKKTRENKTITIDVVNPFTNASYQSQYTLELTSEDAKLIKASETSYTVNYAKDSTVPTIKIVSLINTSSDPDTAPCDKAGTFISSIDESIDYKKDKVSYKVYAKPIKFSYPVISGRITSGDSATTPQVKGKEVDNGQKVYVTKDGEQLGPIVYTTRSTPNTQVYSEINGQFSIDLSSYTWIDNNYSGQYPANQTLKINYPTDKTKELTVNSSTTVINVGALER